MAKVKAIKKKAYLIADIIIFVAVLAGFLFSLYKILIYFGLFPDFLSRFF
jgi:uncharacterized membrane protein SpoIIM required for sporulation